MHEALDAVMDPDDRLPYERAVATARSMLGEEEFERLRAEGRQMSFEQAVEYALPSAEGETAQPVRQPAELEVKIDKEKKARQVAAIVDSDYFRELQVRVQSLRSAGN